ncbi:MAG: Cyclic dehypoxanthine futalosine synthase [Methanobacteriota archaeon]|nr:MAG: Cyclic dehypoxanthine futalosine synthase [Euryarchaeota archaeon]
MWHSILDSVITPDGKHARVTVEDATFLYENAPLEALMKVARNIRRIHNPDEIITYLVDRNVNYTNICTINCQFCSFYRPPGHKEVYTQSIDQISARIGELEAIGGSRVLMQGGVNPELGIEYYTDLLQALVKKHPEIALDCFSPIEIEGIAEVTGLETKEVLRQLKDAGLHGLPGGGAEMLVDDVRLNISPKKGSADNWLRVMSEAQDLKLTTSATNVFGFGEQPKHRVEHMDRIRTLQDESIKRNGDGFTSFISWPVQLENNSFGRRNRGANRLELGAGPMEYLRQVAVSRIFFDNIVHIQASWPTMGLDVAQIAIDAGADDIGSTMMEENVVSASGTTKVLASESELQRTIIRSGHQPRKRDSDYNLLTTMVPDFEPMPTPVPIKP